MGDVVFLSDYRSRRAAVVVRWEWPDPMEVWAFWARFWMGVGR